MSKLDIRFVRQDFPAYLNLSPWDLDASDDETDELEVPEVTVDSSHLVLSEAAIIHDGDKFRTYRGQLEGDDGMSCPVVAKICWPRLHSGAPVEDLLAHEFKLYNNKLKDLQGDIVPRCHGLYCGRTEHGIVTALLLDDLGKYNNKSRDWDEIAPEQKMLLVDAIVRLHQAGVQHNSLDWDNIILKDGQRWFIIDFVNATDHVCGKVMEVQEGALAPLEDSFGCVELFNLIADMGIWRTGYFNLFGKCFAEDSINNKESLEKLAEEYGTAKSRSQERIKEAVDKIWAYLCAIRASEKKCRPREYWSYAGED